jgi:membrane fusion protein, macrolide-specific efflux system
MSGLRSRRTWRHRVLICGLGLVVGAAAFAAVSEVGAPTSAARTETEIVTAADGVVQTTVSGTGDVEAGTDDDVDFATSGTLQHLYVHQGEHVTKGQILASLDPTSAQLTLDQAAATLTAAQDTLTAAEDGSADTAATIAADETTVESNEETVKNDKQALSDTTLRAPVTGTIASLEALFPGDSVAAGSSSSGSSSSGSATTSTSATSTTSSTGSTGSSFAEIVNTNTLTMPVAISEADIGQIRAGQPATVTMDALTGVELAAHVASISPNATDSSDVVSYDVTLDLNQTDPQVLPGMSASAVVIVDQADGVTVPNDAVTGSGAEGTVTMDNNGRRVQSQVVVGLRGTTRSQIVSGVKAGDVLVVSRTLPSVGSTTTTSTTTTTGN